MSDKVNERENSRQRERSTQIKIKLNTLYDSLSYDIHLMRNEFIEYINQKYCSKRVRELRTIWMHCELVTTDKSNPCHQYANNNNGTQMHVQQFDVFNGFIVSFNLMLTFQTVIRALLSYFLVHRTIIRIYILFLFFIISIFTRRDWVCRPFHLSFVAWNMKYFTDVNADRFTVCNSFGSLLKNIQN